ncbi:MAG: cyclase family protein [Blastocatellia bacterium]|nr:cyclase family protein [Blastocatellia bacterium]
MKKFTLVIVLISTSVFPGMFLGCNSQRNQQAENQLPKDLFAQSNSIDVSKLVDLTYNFDETTIYWPTGKPFVWEKESWGLTKGNYWYAAARYSASEHGGTHIDAPLHFGQGQQSAEQIPISRLVGPAVVIDITRACEKNADYSLTVDDINSWENSNGRIPDNSILLVYTGWGKYWPNKAKYLGTEKPEDVTSLHFPGISREAAEFIANQRKIGGVGIDTASLDHGSSQDFMAHQILNGANIYGLENIADLGKLPARGATLIALPMKIKGGSGGPVRIIAILP